MAASRDDYSKAEEEGEASMEDGDQSPREDTPPAPCAAFCGPRSCSTLPPSLSQQQQLQQQQQQAQGASEPKRRRLWGLRGLVKMFRRRVRRRAGESLSPQPPQPTLRARSTSELAVALQHRSSGPYNQGLSVSHDSVFSPEAAADAHHHHHSTPPALAIATRGVNMAELKAALRRRRGDDSGSGEDDPGLPRSPPTSPTTLDVLNHGLKSCSRATHSTCSDGSLLSMGSSENDEDSLGAGSHHSSRVSLLEARHQVVDNEPVVGAVRLSHQAAFHKIAVRPRRTHGAPRSRRATQIAGQISLPDVIEEANNKNAISRKPSTVATPSPLPSIPHPDTDTVEESLSTSVESQAHTEHEFDKKEKDKEEKRDEPLFQRLFGSKRSGRRQSRGSGDDSRENSVSPLRRGGDQRASRERRRDSSGTRFPVIVGASSKAARQESHPLPPSGRTRETSRERVTKETPSTSPQSLLMASVEGSLESTTPVPQPSFHISPYDERPIRLTEGVRKVKSFREVPEQNKTREVVRRKVSSQTNVEDQNSVPTKISRISASLESLEAVEVTQKSSAFYTNSNKTVLNETSSSQRSSTDSLTTTPIPGVFIRQQSQSHNKTVLQKHQEHLQQVHHQQIGGLEMNSGPFSLDSSISLQSRESEDILRKAASVDHVSCTVDTHQAKEPDCKEPTVQKSAEVKATAGLTLNVIEGKIESEKSESKKPPVQISRSHSIHKSEESFIQGSPPEEGEVDGECAPRRPLRKEPSMKRLPPRDPEPTPVPEFMRIQLNRVESKGQSVIYDTEQEKNAKNDKKDVDVISKKPEALAVTESIQKEIQIYERPIESSIILKKEASNVINSKENNVQTAPSVQKSIQGNRGIFRDTSPTGNTTEYGDGDSGTEGTLSDSSVEHVVLRKPLVSERTPIIERACSVTNQMPSSPSAREQPELFKVFARRSFKVKDVDKDKSESTDIDEPDVEASSEVSEVTISPVRTHNNSSPVPCVIGSPLSTVSLSLSPEGLQKPSINAISFNRKSVGNPALSFCLPPVSATDIPVVSPLTSKPIVLVLSSNNITVTTSSEITITSSSRNITTISSTTNITTTSSQNKPTTMPIQVTAAHPIQTVPVIPAVSESAITISTTPSTGIISKIISNRVNNVASIDDDCSGNEIDNSSSELVISSTPTKQSLLSRSGSGIIWPPRLHQDQDESQQAAQQTQILSAIPVPTFTPQKKLSVSSISDYEDTRDSDQTEETEIEVSPLDIGAARRRFMSGGKDCSRAPVTPPTQNLLPASTSSALGTPPSSSVNNSPGNPSSIIAKTASSVTEARNTIPTFTITVRTQAAPSTSRSDSLPATTSVTNPSTDLNSSITSTSSTTSIGKLEQGTTQQAAEDWRVLVRQRREDRLKQTKTPDSEEIIIETRPPVSRNSKVLEMANNFQKLQVA
nr:serine-rich adhesin for platelets-like isoform X2 [Procambarus clarkii]